MNDVLPDKTAKPRTELERLTDETLRVALAGSWRVARDMPSSAGIRDAVNRDARIRQVVFNTEELLEWDSSLLVFLRATLDLCLERGITVDKTALPEGVQRLLALAFAEPADEEARRSPPQQTLLGRIGASTVLFADSAAAMLSFIGEASFSFMLVLLGRARLRGSDLWRLIQECGVQALPIVTLISVLVGLILAFVGAVQLRLFGAEIYIADLVAIGMAREMGAMMAAIIMAGRTGAAYAAQLGAMQVNEEIDAMRTLGISPMEMLVLPRIMALIVMMPLLCIYADLAGMLGGGLIAATMLDLPIAQYVRQTQQAIDLNDLLLGIFKSGFFGVLIASSGCLRGMECGRSASSVGLATTSAVVTAIVAIVVTDGLFAVITNVLGI
jgi:phospholipid/cholesterol/gamma-HCH transport system permease protein